MESGEWGAGCGNCSIFFALEVLIPMLYPLSSLSTIASPGRSGGRWMTSPSYTCSEVVIRTNAPAFGGLFIDAFILSPFFKRCCLSSFATIVRGKHHKVKIPYVSTLARYGGSSLTGA